MCGFFPVLCGKVHAALGRGKTGLFSSSRCRCAHLFLHGIQIRRQCGGTLPAAFDAQPFSYRPGGQSGCAAHCRTKICARLCRRRRPLDKVHNARFLYRACADVFHRCGTAAQAARSRDFARGGKLFDRISRRCRGQSAGVCIFCVQRCTSGLLAGIFLQQHICLFNGRFFKDRNFKNSLEAAF